MSVLNQICASRPVISIILTCILLPPVTAAAQNRQIDSLKAVFRAMPEPPAKPGADTNKINLLNRLSRLLMNAGSYDSALSYAGLARDKASAPAAKSASFKRGLGRAYNNVGLVYYYRGNYPEALKNQLAALSIQEAAGDRQGMANSYNHMGMVNYGQGYYDEALKCHEASLKIKKTINDRKGICASYVNIGNIYLNRGDYAGALKNYFACLSETEKTGDKLVMGTCYNNIGNAYMRQNNYAYALKNTLAALEIRKGMGDQYSDAMSYANLGEIYIKMERYGEAEPYALKALALSEAIGALELVKESNNALGLLYEKTGRPAKALRYYRAYIDARDSLMNEANSRKTLQTQLQYQFDKKFTADSIRIAEEKKVIELQFRHEKKQRLALYCGLVVLVIFAAFMVNRFRGTRRQKDIIEQKEKETQRQNEIIAHQKDMVEGKQKEIVDSINYALRIQRSLLASETLMEKNLRLKRAAAAAPADYFVLFEPKDIVSGDFYWASMLHNGEFALAIADSTGHGVPGAIMSIINTACLNEVVNKNISSPDEILFETRKRIINYLKNDGSEDGGRDGMDCSLLSFNFETG